MSGKKTLQKKNIKETGQQERRKIISMIAQNVITVHGLKEKFRNISSKDIQEKTVLHVSIAK